MANSPPVVIITTTISSASATITEVLTSTIATSSTSFASTTSSSSSPTSTSDSSSSSSTSSSFYRNLFYILIGLLVAFGLVAFLSLLRAKRRRNAILREADRLGVLVPGVPGYIPVRERRIMTWTRPNGSELPEWWEIEAEEKARAGMLGDVEKRLGWGSGEGYGSDSHSDQLSDFQPLAVIPPREDRPLEPIEQSSVPFFPNHLAYRASSLLPPPSRYTADSPASLDALGGETLDVITVIRMPSMPLDDRRSGIHHPNGDDDEDDEVVVREWGGIELGIAKFDVNGSSQAPQREDTRRS